MRKIDNKFGMSTTVMGMARGNDEFRVVIICIKVVVLSFFDVKSLTEHDYIVLEGY